MTPALLIALALTAGSPAPIKVAAASDLAFAFKEVGAAFEKETGIPVIFTFGSTGLLSKQIAEGAPFDLLAAANVSFVDDLVRKGHCDGATQALYARGRVVIWTLKGGVPPPKAIADLKDPRFKKIALGNPEHAPYGKAAKEALQRAGIWDAIASRVVYGENIQQTLQYGRSGNVDAALVALSLALAAPDGEHLLVDDALHAPLDQALAACKYGKNTGGGARFARFVGSPAGRAIMRRFGFVLPGEAAARR